MSDPALPTTSLPKCPGCNRVIRLRAPGTSVFTDCPECGALVDVRGSIPKLAGRRQDAQPLRSPLLKLGLRGEWEGVTYEVIGMLERAEDAYSWHEYLLYNPTGGLRWLVLQQGHWSFGEPVHDSTLHLESKANLTGDVIYGMKNFRCFHRGRSTLRYVVGEFPWRAKPGEKATTIDYICPPRMLTLETSKNERHWTLLHYVPAAEIGKAFGITLPDPSPAKLVPHMVNPHNGTFLRLGVAAAVLSVVLAIAHQVATNDLEQETVLADSAMLTDAYAGKTVALGPFNIRSRISAVDISTSASLDNQWLDLDLALVNVATQASFEVSQGLERYRGVDSEGPWVEGSNWAETRIGEVPPGQYTLLVDATSGDSAYPRYDGPISVRITAGVADSGPFWYSLLLLLCVPAWYYWRYREFEKTRWSESEHNPYEED